MTTSPFTADDRGYMEQAIALAGLGFGHTKPNPLVGAVIVKDGIVVGRGYHTAWGKAHAEVEALRDAGKKANGATIYVTLEPCNHHGKTPPCTEAIMAAGIAKVIIGSLDPNPCVTGGGMERLKNEGLEVFSGLLQDQCDALNIPFLRAMAANRPYVLLKAAISVDGYLATRSGDSGQNSGGMSGPQSAAHVHRTRAEFDAIMVGAGTVKADNPRLTARNLGDVRQPRPIVLDANLSMPVDARLLESPQRTVFIYAADDADVAKEQALVAKGAKVIRLPRNEKGWLGAEAILADLWERGVVSLMVEGGSLVHQTFLMHGCFDKIELFMVPRIFGDGIGLSQDFGAKFLSDTLPIRFIGATALGDDILIEAVGPSRDD